MTIVINKHFSGVGCAKERICVCAARPSSYEVSTRPLESHDEVRAFCKHSNAAAFSPCSRKAVFRRRLQTGQGILYGARRIEMFATRRKNIGLIAQWPLPTLL